jgi:hypothetical protein
MKNVNVMMAVAAIAATAGCTCDRVCEAAKCPTPFPEWSAPRAITSGPHDHFFASYYGINSWSPDNRYVSVLETDLNGRLPDAGEECTLGLVDTQDGHRFIPVAKTSCWNFQEAAMAHWLPDEPDTLLYNDCRAGKFVTVILNWKTKRERIVPYPVSAVSPDGRWAVSINYARLSLTRPDYGYAGLGQDTRESVVWPEDDGLWLVNLKTGEAKLILSVAAARPFMPQTKDGKGLAYFCHTVFSKDGKRIFFLARSVDWFDKTARKASTWQTTSFTVSADGTNLRRCFKDDWAGSHFNWKDGETMLVTARWNGQKMWSHVEFTDGEEAHWPRHPRLGRPLPVFAGRTVYVV